MVLGNVCMVTLKDGNLFSQRKWDYQMIQWNVVPAMTFTVCGKCPFPGFSVTSLLHHGPRRKKASFLGSWEQHLLTFPTISPGLGTLKGVDTRTPLFRLLSFSLCLCPLFFLDGKPGQSDCCGCCFFPAMREHACKFWWQSCVYSKHFMYCFGYGL